MTTPTPDQARSDVAEIITGNYRPDVVQRIVDYITASEKEIAALTKAATYDNLSDRKDELSEVIRVAHPTLNKANWPHWTRAIELVSNRHSKYALVDLTSYLLSQLAERDALLAEAGEVLEPIRQCAVLLKSEDTDRAAYLRGLLTNGEIRKAASVAQKIREVK